ARRTRWTTGGTRDLHLPQGTQPGRRSCWRHGGRIRRSPRLQVPDQLLREGEVALRAGDWVVAGRRLEDVPPGAGAWLRVVGQLREHRAHRLPIDLPFAEWLVMVLDVDHGGFVGQPGQHLDGVMAVVEGVAQIDVHADVRRVDTTNDLLQLRHAEAGLQCRVDTGLLGGFRDLFQALDVGGDFMGKKTLVRPLALEVREQDT